MFTVPTQRFYGDDVRGIIDIAIRGKCEDYNYGGLEHRVRDGENREEVIKSIKIIKEYEKQFWESTRKELTKMICGEIINDMMSKRTSDK